MKKLGYKTIILTVLALLVLSLSYFYTVFHPAEKPDWGLSFSTESIQYLGFDWKTAYLDILNDLKPKKLRLMAYWELIEPNRGQFDFQTVDEMLAEAGKRDIRVILVVGRKQPRWPECHQPSWYKDLSAADRDKEQLIMIEQAVKHFKNFEAVKMWQVENEPLFGFGPDCPKINKEFFGKEIGLVKSLDNRPVVVTDSGELGRWLPTAKVGGDVFGSTMYRVVHNPKFGYFKYPLPPAFFKIKAGFLSTFTGIKEFINVELQAEPWFETDVYSTDLKTQFTLMNPKIFKENIAYAQSVGFKENYLWGVEWWYWLAKSQNDWGMWQEAKNLLNSSGG